MKIYIERNRVSSRMLISKQESNWTRLSHKKIFLLFISDSSSCKMKYKPIRSGTYLFEQIFFFQIDLKKTLLFIRRGYEKCYIYVEHDFTEM